MAERSHGDSLYMWGAGDHGTGIEVSMQQQQQADTTGPSSSMQTHHLPSSGHINTVNNTPAHINQPQSPLPPTMFSPPMVSSTSSTTVPGGPQMTVHHPPVTSMPTSSAVEPPPSTPLVVPQPVKTMKATTKTYHCRMCNQELPNKSAMQKHAKEIHMLDQKAHKCEKCFKSFPTSQQLQQHMLVHSNLRRYKCCHCDKAFKQLSHVQQHQRIHTGEKPYKCTVDGCERAFAQLSNLQHHMRHHEGHHPRTTLDRKPWQCNICDRRFATDASLNNHITKAHLETPVSENPLRSPWGSVSTGALTLASSPPPLIPQPSHLPLNLQFSLPPNGDAMARPDPQYKGGSHMPKVASTSPTRSPQLDLTVNTDASKSLKMEPWSKLDKSRFELHPRLNTLPNLEPGCFIPRPESHPQCEPSPRPDLDDQGPQQLLPFSPPQHAHEGPIDYRVESSKRLAEISKRDLNLLRLPPPSGLFNFPSQVTPHHALARLWMSRGQVSPP